jgi:hypothetical protein
MAANDLGSPPTMAALACDNHDELPKVFAESFDLRDDEGGIARKNVAVHGAPSSIGRRSTLDDPGGLEARMPSIPVELHRLARQKATR